MNYQNRKKPTKNDWIRTKIDKAEKSGFTIGSKEDILLESKLLLISKRNLK